MDPRPRPMLGALLGLLAGLVLVALAWQLGWIDPSRLVVFLAAAILMLAVATLLTRSIADARGRYVTVAIAAGILAGVGLTGIPEQFARGSVSDGCTIEARAGDTVVVPSDTSAFDPWVVAPDTVAPWSATSDVEIAVTQRVGGLYLAGFEVPLNTVTVEGAPPAQELSGEADVAQVLAWFEDRTGLEISGTYHAYGAVSGDGGACTLDGYVRLAPASLYGTNVLVGLEITLGVLLILIAWGAIAVRMSFSRAARARVDAQRVYSESTTAGGDTRGPVTRPAAGDAAPLASAAPPAAAAQPAAAPEPAPPVASEVPSEVASEATDRTRETVRRSTTRPSAGASQADRQAVEPAADAVEVAPGEGFEPPDDLTHVEEPEPAAEAEPAEDAEDTEPAEDTADAEEIAPRWTPEIEEPVEVGEPVDLWDREPSDDAPEAVDDGEPRIVPEDADATPGDSDATPGDSDATPGDGDGPEPAPEGEDFGPRP